MASTEIRERRRTLRYRNLLVRRAVQMKNKIAVLLMEAGVSYNKQKLHKVGYFRELLATNEDIDAGLKPLLRLRRETMERLGKTESALVRSLERDSFLVERVERLMAIPAVGPITALTWALEVGDVQRFCSIKKAISYCGLCGAGRSSVDSLRIITTLEFFEHHFAKSGHRDLLMTRQLTSAVRHKLPRSPHAKRPPHGRLRSSRLTGKVRSRLAGYYPLTKMVPRAPPTMKAINREIWCQGACSSMLYGNRDLLPEVPVERFRERENCS
jgi:hypothetical protein